MSDNPLANVGDLAQPLDTLVKKLSNAVGTLYEPRRIRKAAEAEANAAITKATSEIEITDLHQRAEQRRIEEDARHQKNMEDIIAKTAPHLNKDVNPDAMDNDWVANWFDKCRIVSDDEMQSLWARVLAGEANTPGAYSKRTVNLLSDLDKRDADLFTQLCGFGWMIGNFVPLVFYVQADIYNRNGINYETLTHLESIGLIHFAGIGEVARDVPKRFTVSYYGKSLRLEIPEVPTLLFKTGQVLLTKMGQELAPICGSTPVEGFYEYVKEQWKEFLPTVEKQWFDPDFTESTRVCDRCDTEVFLCENCDELTEIIYLDNGECPKCATATPKPNDPHIDVKNKELNTCRKCGKSYDPEFSTSNTYCDACDPSYYRCDLCGKPTDWISTLDYCCSDCTIEI